MSVARNVLLADPILLGHSFLYYKAALSSTGFENTKFTIAAAIQRPEDGERFRQFGLEHPQACMRLLEVDPGPCLERWESWRGFWRALRATEEVLRSESFELVVLLNLDLALVFFAFPVFRKALRGLYAARPSGTLLRDNGLRPVLVGSLKARARAATDRWILRRALNSGVFRRVSFLDHWCADRARERFSCSICTYGVDPVFARSFDGAAARARFGLRQDDFVFLLFGALSQRKGIVESLTLLCRAELPPEKTAIVVAGPVHEPYRRQLEEALAITQKKYRVVRHERFVEDEELPPYFAACDCAVCVYNEFSGSSNVLLQACVFGKTALVSPGGVMEDAVRRYGFGEVVSFDKPDEFVARARRLVSLSPSERAALGERARRYAETMDARQYMTQFI